MVRPEGYSSAEIFLGEERQGERMRNISPKLPTQSWSHFCQIVHAEKNNDWEMSVFCLWEHQGETFPNLHLTILELLLFLILICLSSLLRENSDTNISFDLKWLKGEKVGFFFSFQFVNSLLTTSQNIQWTKTTLQILCYECSSTSSLKGAGFVQKL